MHLRKVWPRGIANAGNSVEASDLYRLDDHVRHTVNGDDGGLWVPATSAQNTSGWNFNKTAIVNQITPPVDADSGTSAVYLVDTTDNSQHTIFQRLASFVAGATYVFSTFAKKSPVRYLWIGQDGPNFVYFDLQGGVVGATGGTATGAITSVGNGWYYCTATLPAFATNRVFVGMSTINGNATYAGAGNGVLLYKTLVDLESDPTRRRAVVIGGAGLTPTLTPTKNPLFAEPGGLRTYVREISALPATLKSGGALPTSGSFIEGQASGASNGLAADRQLFLLDLPDGATVVSVTAFLRVVGILRSPLPTTLPGISVLRTNIATGAEQELRAAGRSNFPAPTVPDAYISPPAGPTVSPVTGGLNAVQQWSYVADQMNPVDRTTYFYSVRLYDESGGTATPGNTFLGYYLTYVTPDLRPA